MHAPQYPFRKCQLQYADGDSFVFLDEQAVAAVASGQACVVGVWDVAGPDLAVPVPRSHWPDGWAQAACWPEDAAS